MKIKLIPNKLTENKFMSPEKEKQVPLLTGILAGTTTGLIVGGMLAFFVFAAELVGIRSIGSGLITRTGSGATAPAFITPTATTAQTSAPKRSPPPPPDLQEKFFPSKKSGHD